MADRLATLLGIESEVLVSEKLLMAQDDIRSIGKSVDTLLMELDQQALEAYMSSDSEGSAAGRARRTRKTGDQSSLLNTWPITALPNRVPKHLNPIKVTSQR